MVNTHKKCHEDIQTLWSVNFYSQEFILGNNLTEVNIYTQSDSLQHHLSWQEEKRKQTKYSTKESI